MSNQECSWAMRQRGISSRSKFVLLVLGNASTDWRADYSLRYLAEQTELSEKACQQALNSLLRSGCIKWCESKWCPHLGRWRDIAYLNEGRPA